MSFTLKSAQNNKISLLDVNDIREQVKFTTNIYQKPTFSGVRTHFDSFLPNTYEIGIAYTLFNKCFRICSD